MVTVIVDLQKRRTQAMPDYRVYTLLKPDKIAGRADVVTCATDAEAVVKARRFLQSNDIEVWQGARMVGRLNARHIVVANRPVETLTQYGADSGGGR
jgi:hypothetical protein